MVVEQEKEKKMCTKCARAMDVTNFYRSNNLDKYPNNGYVDECKKCFAMHLNNFEPTTFIGLLEKLDIPYIDAEWNVLLNRYAAPDKIHKLGPNSILGRYISKMKLEQFRNYRFEDGPKIAEMRRDEIEQKHILAENRRQMREQLLADQYKESMTPSDIENMSDAELDALYDQNIMQKEAQEGHGSAHDMYNPETYVLPEDSLTNDDRIHLSLKWGKLYKPQEWIQLEQFFSEMIEAFDIQTPAHMDYLKLICKTSLKMNQAIDCGDVEGFNKLAKVYDNLMKSSNFTAAQNKSESGEFVDSIGELIYHFELNNGFVPEFHSDEPKDIVDITLKDFKDYTYRLVTEERGLGDMIESALAQMIEMEQQESAELDDNDDYLNIADNEILIDVAGDTSSFEFDEIEDDYNPTGELSPFAQNFDKELPTHKSSKAEDVENIEEEEEETIHGLKRPTEYDF